MKNVLPRWINTPWRRAAGSNLLVDVTTSRHVQRGPNAHAGPVQRPRSRFRDVAAAVHLLIVDRVLVVVVGLQGQLGPAYSALEAARVKEGEILQWAHPVHLVHGLRAPQTRALVKVGPIHRPSSIRILLFHFLFLFCLLFLAQLRLDVEDTACVLDREEEEECW